MSQYAFGIRSLSIAASLLCALTACRGNNGIAMPPVIPLAGAQREQMSLPPLGKGKIKHVVIIIQENRSFNNLFYGYPGARTVKYGYACVEKTRDVAPAMVPDCGQGFKRIKVRLKPISLSQKWDMRHNGQDFIISCNGTGTFPALTAE